MPSRILFFLMLMGTLIQTSRAQQKSQASSQVFGKPFVVSKAIQARELPQVLGQQDSLSVQVIGQVRDVCQAKGCWMDVQLPDNTVMKVRFENYAFFVPKNLKGETVILNGKAYKQTVSVAEQRHYAEDAGQSKAQIQAITKPRKSISYMASGVRLK